MSLAEIPGKLIERTESLTEAKLQVAASLTNIVYSSNKENITEEQVLATYFNLYDAIKVLAPPPLGKVRYNKITLIFIIGAILATFIFLTIFWPKVKIFA